MAESVCPSQEAVIELAVGRLRGDSAVDIRSHTRSCPRCSIFLIGLSETAGGACAEKELALSDTAAGEVEGALCPPQETLIELALGRLRGGAAAEIRAHTKSCRKCSKFLIGLRDSAAESSAIEDLALSDTAGGSNSLLDPEKPAQFVAEFHLVR